jgi:type II secretory pathway pseudopilin PulG
LTLLEVLVAVSLLGVVLGVPTMLLLSGSRTYAIETASSDASEALRTGIARIATRLETAVSGSLTPPPPAATHTLDYNRSNGYAGGAVALGPLERIQFENSPGDPNDGLDNDGDGLVDEGRAVWIENPGQATERRVTLVDWVAEAQAGELLGNNLDDNGNGLVDEGGLSLEYDANRVTVRLTVQRPGPEGSIITRSMQRTIALRN